MPKKYMKIFVYIMLIAMLGSALLPFVAPFIFQ